MALMSERAVRAICGTVNAQITTKIDQSSLELSGLAAAKTAATIHVPINAGIPGSNARIYVRFGSFF